jgi:hypothetical protein
MAAKKAAKRDSGDVFMMNSFGLTGSGKIGSDRSNRRGNAEADSQDGAGDGSGESEKLVASSGGGHGIFPFHIFVISGSFRYAGYSASTVPVSEYIYFSVI